MHVPRCMSVCVCVCVDICTQPAPSLPPLCGCACRRACTCLYMRACVHMCTCMRVHAHMHPCIMHAPWPNRCSSPLKWAADFPHSGLAQAAHRALASNRLLSIMDTERQSIANSTHAPLLAFLQTFFYHQGSDADRNPVLRPCFFGGKVAAPSETIVPPPPTQGCQCGVLRPAPLLRTQAGDGTFP